MEKHSLKEIIGLLKDRKISEKELLQHYFSRINKFNPSLNALVSLRSIDEVLKDLENLKGCSVQKKTKSLEIFLELFGYPEEGVYTCDQKLQADRLGDVIPCSHSLRGDTVGIAVAGGKKDNWEGGTQVAKLHA